MKLAAAKHERRTNCLIEIGERAIAAGFPTLAEWEALKGEEHFMAQAGLLKGKVDYDTWVDRSFYEAAAAQATASN